MRIEKIIYSLTLLFLLQSLAFAESSFGVCAHLNRWEFPELKEETKLIKDAGIGFVRTDLDWGQVQPNTSTWNFSRWDKVVEECEKNNLQILPIFGGHPWYAKIPSEHLDLWEAYLKAALERYKGKIKYWEVYNEADLTPFWKENSAGYFELLKKSYTIIKEADSDAKVLLTGLGGIPEKYISSLLRMGAGEYFDIMNIHPYDFNFPPERALAGRLKSLKSLMKKFNIENKEIWITEIGNSSGENEKSYEALALRSIKQMGVNLQKDTAYFLCDAEYFYNAKGLHGFSSRVLENFKSIKPIKFSEIKNLNANADKILILDSSQYFPYEFLESLQNYLGQGGRVFMSGGIPLYLNMQKRIDGSLKIDATMQALESLGMKVNPHWSMQNVPNKTDSLDLGKDFAKMNLPKFNYGSYFLETTNLKEGDSFEPILIGHSGAYKGAIAGIYKFKKGGQIAAFASLLDEVTTEKEQAKFLPRAHLIAYSEGVKKIFQYNFRSNENDITRESHFGIVRKNLEKKPAYYAYKTLIEKLGEGFTNLKIEKDTVVYHASWDRADGKKMNAIWTSAGNDEVYLQMENNAQIWDMLGKSIYEADMKKARSGVIKIEVSDSIIYFSGLIKNTKKEVINF